MKTGAIQVRSWQMKGNNQQSRSHKCTGDGILFVVGAAVLCPPQTLSILLRTFEKSPTPAVICTQ